MSGQNSVKEIITPKWLNRDFFETVLRSYKPDEFVKLRNFDINNVSTKDEDYTNVIYYAFVEYFDTDGRDEISLIIKTLPDQGDNMNSELSQNCQVFDFEIKVYQDIIPQFEKMLKDIGDKTVFAPQVIYCSTSPRKVIVLEDITKNGFSVIGNKLNTIQEFKMAIDKLAKWYACSYVMNEENPGCFDSFTDGIYNLSNLSNHNFLGKGLERLTKLTAVEPDLQKYTATLEKLQTKIMKKTVNTYEICKTKSKIKVLCHGNLNAKNLMYRYVCNNLPVNLLLLDFQTCIWSSMALDVIYSIYMMLDTKANLQYENELILYYFEKFQENLKKLNFKGTVPTYFDYEDDLENLIHLHIYLASTFLVLFAMPNETDNLNLNDLFNSKTDVDWLMTVYKSKSYKNMIKPLLDKFSRKGYWSKLSEDNEE